MLTALRPRTAPVQFWHEIYRWHAKPYIKNKLRSYQVKNMKKILGHAIQEDQKQKIRALDFRATTSQGSGNKTNCSINAIRNDGCFKCGSEEHFIKDCPLNQTDHGTHAGCKVAKNGDSSLDKVMEPLSRFFTDLVEQIKLLVLRTWFPKGDTHLQYWTQAKTDGFLQWSWVAEQ